MRFKFKQKKTIIVKTTNQMMSHIHVNLHRSLFYGFVEKQRHNETPHM